MASAAQARPAATPKALALSPSRLETWTCPYRYQQLIVRGVKEPDTAALEQGRAVHDVAANYVRHLVAAKLQTDHAQLDAIAGNVWAGRSAVLSEEHRPDFAGLVRELRGLVIEPELVLGTERQIAFADDWSSVEWYSQSAAWRSIFDLVETPEGRLRITDWTTAAVSGAHGARKDLQLRFYGLMAWRAYSNPEVEIVLWSLRTGSRVVVELAEEDHHKTERRIRDERERIRKQLEIRGDWPAIPGGQCGFCRLACPEVDRALSRGVPLRLETAEQAALAHQTFIVLDRQLSGLREALKSYVGVHGAIESSGRAATFRTQLGHDYDTPAVYDALRAAGFSHGEAVAALSVDRSAVGKLCRGREDLWQAIQTLDHPKTQEKFYASVSSKGGEE